MEIIIYLCGVKLNNLRQTTINLSQKNNMNTNMNNEKITTGISDRIFDLPVDGSCSFEIKRLRSVRSTASMLSLMYSRKYITRSDRDNRLVHVIRVE